MPDGFSNKAIGDKQVQCLVNRGATNAEFFGDMGDKQNGPDRDHRLADVVGDNLVGHAINGQRGHESGGAIWCR